jgi:hypothetical protein
MISVRSSLSAGLVAGLVAAGSGAAFVAPAAVVPMPVLASPAVQLSAAVAALPQPAAAAPTLPGPFVPGAADSAGDAIINGYNAIQPWVQYGVELGAWAVGWLPWPIGLLGPQTTIVYSGVEPMTRALVYSTAYLIDGQPELVGPTLVNGFQTGVNNFVQGEAAWIAGFFPPLPPISLPVLPGAATAPTPPKLVGKSTAVPKAAATVVVEPVATVDDDGAGAALTAPAEEATPAPVSREPRRGAGRAQPPAPVALTPPGAAAALDVTAPVSDASTIEAPAAKPGQAQRGAAKSKADTARAGRAHRAPR